MPSGVTTRRPLNPPKYHEINISDVDDNDPILSTNGPPSSTETLFPKDSFFAKRKNVNIVMRILGGCFLIYLLVRIDLYLVRSGFFDPDVTNKTMHIYSMPETLVTKAQGMFADFLAVIGALKYGLAHSAAALYVHYDNPFYLDLKRGNNWWAYFFEPVMPLKYETPKATSLPNGSSDSKKSVVYRAGEFTTRNPTGDVHFQSYNARFGQIGSFSQVVTKGVGIEEDPAVRKTNFGTNNDGSGVAGMFREYPYPVNGGLGLEDVRKIVQNHIQVRPHITEKVSHILRQELKIGEDEFIIGLHYRGLDKIDAYPFVPVPVDLYRQVVASVVDIYKPAKWRVYLATDTQDFVDWAKMVWGDKVAVRDIARIKLDDVEYQPDGTPVPLHKTGKVAPYDKAEGAVIDMLVLAACDYIVKNRSSLSDTSLAFMTRNQNYTFLLGPSDPVYSSDIRIPLYFRFQDDDFMAKKMASLRKKEASWFTRMISP